MAKKEKSIQASRLILKLFSRADISVIHLQFLEKKLLSMLLLDRTTGRNIIWGCKEYEDLGDGFAEKDEMTVAALTGENDGLIIPRALKPRDAQPIRTKGKSDVFTPTWICNLQNNLIDEPFFGRSNAFNYPRGQKEWCIRSKDFDKRGHVWFPEGKAWQDYVLLNRMEMTCGEAPYLVSRYNMEDGKLLPITRRIGILDRKLRVVTENTRNERQWLKWAYETFRHTYGFEWQGDMLLLARLNLLSTFVDYYKEKFRKAPSVASLMKVAQITSWNVWQMDGLNGQLPYTVSQDFMENPLFPEANKHFSLVMDWDKGEAIHFVQLQGKRCNSTLRFEAVVGNPPYQKNSASDVNGAPVYHLFMDGAALMGERSAVIHPARFLYDAGKTPRSWNRKIRTNPHYKLTHFFADSREIFTGVDIKGGVAITLHDQSREFPAISTYFSNAELSAIVSRVMDAADFTTFSDLVYPRDLYRFTETLFEENPFLEGRQSKGHRYDVGSGAFDLFPEIFTDEQQGPEEETVCLWGRQGGARTMKWVKRRYLKVPDNVDSYKVLVAKSNGKGAMGEPISLPIVSKPVVGHTSTFLSIGRFTTFEEAEACWKYIKTKFARALLSSLKVTQDNPREVWQNIPLQDFTPHSDISWNRSIKEIDQQLYDKYKLSEEEQSFIESQVRPME